MGDVFADLLSGASKKKTDDASMSMSQRMNKSSSSYSSLNASRLGQMDLGILEQPKTQHKATDSTLNDLLSSFTEPSSRTATPVPKATSNGTSKANGANVIGASATNTTASTADLLEGFFSSPAQPVQQGAPEPINPEPIKPRAQTPPVVQTGRPSSEQELKDETLAELVDMGFPIERATIALDATSNGRDLNEAINYLMTQAHEQSRPTAPKTYSEDDGFGSIVNDLSTEFMSKASFLLNSGRKKVQEGIEMYKQHQFERNDHQPQWMKNQQVYKAKSTLLPGQDEQEDFDVEQMRRLTEFQRSRDRQIHRHGSESSTEERQTYGRTQSARPVQPARSARKSTPPQPLQPVKSKKAQPVQPVSSAPTEQLLNLTDTPSSNVSIPALSPTQNSLFTDTRADARNAFINGDFTKALELYIAAFAYLPEEHPFRIIILSNVAAVQEKLGNSKAQLESSVKGLALVDALSKTANIETVALENNKLVKEFWAKLLLRKAVALEHLEKFPDALNTYNKLVDNGVSTKPVIEGRRRSMEAINGKPRPHVSSVRPKSSSATQTKVSQKAAAALHKIQQQDAVDERIENEKFQLHDKVEAALNRWSSGNNDNIRALLVGLQDILWPELHWKPVTMTDLVLAKKVRIAYMKAVSKVHPDKIAKDTSTERKMIANGVFITLNDAWEKYKETNHI